MEKKDDLELPGYETIGKIGHGSYGSVYKGKRLSNNKTVAIKKIKINDNSDYISRRHAIMVCRELYILYKLTKEKTNTYTIQLVDVQVNPEAYEDSKKLHTLYLITNLEKVDLSTLMSGGTNLDVS
jgi:serine/threonine protein kinase